MSYRTETPNNFDLGRLLPWIFVVVLGAILLTDGSIMQKLFNPKPADESAEMEKSVTEKPLQEDEGKIVVQSIEALGRIELIKYELKDVVAYEKPNKFLPQDKILMVIGGEAVGCIDFTKITAAHVSIQGDSMLITLPKPELCYHKLVMAKCKVYDVSMTQIFNQTPLVEQAYKMAEKRIEKMALESNILEQTRRSSELMLKPFLEKITKKTVLLNFTTLADSSAIIERGL